MYGPPFDYIGYLVLVGLLIIVPLWLWPGGDKENKHTWDHGAEIFGVRLPPLPIYIFLGLLIIAGAAVLTESSRSTGSSPINGSQTMVKASSSQ